MCIKLGDFKRLFWKASMLSYRVFHLVDGCTDVNRLPLLWETKKRGDWSLIGGEKYDNYFVQEIQTNIANTLDILISKEFKLYGDEREKHE